MSNQTIIYLLAFISFALVIITQLRRRTTTVKEWFQENRWAVSIAFLTATSFILIGPGDNVDLGSYVARSWAAGIGGTVAYIIGGNIPSSQASARRLKARALSAAADNE